MQISKSKIEEVLNRFANDDGDTENDIGKSNLSATKLQKFEFKMAFRVVAGDNCNALSYDKIYQLFLAIGLTLQDGDIDRFCYRFIYSMKRNFGHMF